MSKGSTIRISNLNVSYSSLSVLKDFSLFVKSGENVLLCGPNGCGKTTLLKVLLGLVKSASGIVQISDTRPGSVAYCTQEKATSDFPISVDEVLSLGLGRGLSKSEASSRMKEALALTNCSGLLGRNFFSLSGGEKQRVSLARCLCQKPSLLLLDEPSTFLDASGQKELFSILDNLAKTPLTIIMVSHENQVFDHFASWRVVRMKKEGL